MLITFVYADECPGINQFFSTINPAKFDGMSDPDLGFPIFNIGNLTGVFPFGSGTCSYPQTITIRGNSQGTCNAISFAASSLSNFSQSLSDAVSAKFGGLFNSASLSFAVQEALSMSAFGSYALSMAICQLSTYDMEVGLVTNDFLQQSFINDITNLLINVKDISYLGNQQNWLQFAQTYGTAYIKKATFGGTFIEIITQTMDDFNAQGSLADQSEIRFHLMSLYTAAGGKSTSSANASTAWKNTIKSNSVSFYGGSCIPGSSGCSFNQWFSTLPIKPRIIKAEFESMVSIYALINPILEEPASDMIGNFTVINKIKGEILPSMNNYYKFFSEINIPSNSSCAAFPECQGFNNEYCCTFPRQGEFPNQNRIQQMKTKLNYVNGMIYKVQSICKNITASNWVSRDTYQALMILVGELDAMYAMGVGKASCGAIYNQNHDCGSKGYYDPTLPVTGSTSPSCPYRVHQMNLHCNQRDQCGQCSTCNGCHHCSAPTSCPLTIAPRVVNANWPNALLV